ncbi:adenosylcobinamide-GDP ribazoletransferase [Glycomyces sp. L485]|uniref:adenosylcobinamide-GDP ribazoletransferase n=1 Tax=Glycomyces sp. L485 TaxID=2909235 RepID=UPI001F4B9F85|nr:adenosylcobinamide-GDP ribazoletransferase [Glycomyces sp. L485]MCH7230835.1 adenosylcobinamide-GDP ribazoletransferase [Glycomyces sp. L485]
MRAVCDALGFLTVLPVRGRWPLTGTAVAAFPLAGLVVGLAWAGAAWAGFHIGGPLVAAALVLAVDFALTGGLHLDGVADTADGLASHRPPDRVAEVMKDPRVGAVGAAALVVTLLLRFALLGSIAGSVGAWPLLALAPVVGRLSLVWQLRANRPREGSLAAGPAAAATRGALIVAALWTAALAAVIGFVGDRGWVVGLAAAAAGLAVALTASRRWRRRLGTGGDTIGAGGVLAETTALAVLAAS